MPLSTIDNALLASSICFFKTDKCPIISPINKRHCIWNGLALILNGSESCTSVYLWLKKKQILITRNKLLTNDDEIYFNRFFDLIRIYSSYCLSLNKQGMIETHAILRSIVFEYNKVKCINRIIDSKFDTAISSLEALLIVNIDRICENITNMITDKISKRSADYIYIKVQKMSLKEYIQILFSWINRIVLLRKSIIEDKNNVDLKTIENFQIYAELLYSSAIFRLILSYTNVTIDYYQYIQYYIEKVSAHLRSLDSILICLQQRTSELCEIYKNIEWYFIEPIETIVELNEALSSSFDQIWKDANLPEGDMKRKFIDEHIGNKFDNYKKGSTLTTYLHSEIRMIDYLIEHNIKEAAIGVIEIGISKPPCYLCSLYIEELNQAYNRIFPIGDLKNHGKIYPNWMFRNNEDELIKDRINDQLYHLIKNKLLDWVSRYRTKSDGYHKKEIDIDDDYLYCKLMISLVNHHEHQ
ncbi:unnamed protein product [Rotaria sp. Silwood1]|nr:unnamed protein product [Rotaria sp. Silwood1]CAF3984872.1 unnamed protein product [Rotaria sp. Silwood1]CAF4859744.1 unnamed protein product [Rotaria sp. Silwood1]CAF5094730.1 unnamed protein product [Rotaria sp. Silwood1]